ELRLKGVLVLPTNATRMSSPTPDSASLTTSAVAGVSFTSTGAGGASSGAAGAAAVVDDAGTSSASSSSVAGSAKAKSALLEATRVSSALASLCLLLPRSATATKGSAPKATINFQS